MAAGRVDALDHPAFHRGLDLYARGEFFECHEVWEDLWRPSRQPERLFLQALIHLAVAFHHHQRNNRDGATRQMTKALRKLAGYLPRFGRFDTQSLYESGLEWLEAVKAGRDPGRYPRLSRGSGPTRLAPSFPRG